MPNPGFPTIQGLDYGFSSIRLASSGIPFPIAGIKDFSYSQTLKPGEARGTSSQVQSWSRGTYNAKGSITFYKSQYQAALAQLNTAAAAQGLGYMEAEFDWTASFYELAVGLTTDELLSCRITDDSDQHSEEGGVLVVKVEIVIKQLLRNGIAFSTQAALA